MRIVVFGTGGHAQVVAEAARLAGHDVVGLVGADGKPVDLPGGLRVLASNDTFPEIIASHRVDAAVIALGDTQVRLRLAALVGKHLPFATVVHPAAVISPDARVGEGSVVMAGAVIQTGTVVGEHAIVNTRASLDHHGVIGDGSHVAPGVVLAGHVTVGRRVWIGAGAVVLDRLSIGDDVFVAAGSTVAKNVPSGARFVGTRILYGEK